MATWAAMGGSPRAVARHLVADCSPSLVKSRRFTEEEKANSQAIGSYLDSDSRRGLSPPDSGILGSPPSEVEEGTSLLFSRTGVAKPGPPSQSRGPARSPPQGWREVAAQQRAAPTVATARDYSMLPAAWWIDLVPPHCALLLLGCFALAAFCSVSPLGDILPGHRRPSGATASAAPPSPASWGQDPQQDPQRSLTITDRAAAVGGPASAIGASVVEVLGAGTSKVAIIGCGIAGAMSALELIRQGHDQIAIYEQSPTLEYSTSSMIAATMNLDSNYREWMHGQAMFNVPEMLEKGFIQQHQFQETERWTQFVSNTGIKLLAGDPRVSDFQRRRVFRRSYEHMLLLVERFPQLCTALIGQWCCDIGGEARRFMESGAGVACPSDTDPANSTLGLFQITGDPRRCEWMRESAGQSVNGCDHKGFATKELCEAAGYTWSEIRYAFYDTAQTRERLSGFLQEDTNALCSIVEHKITGYARSEVLFRVVHQLLMQSGVQLGLSCDVASVQQVDGSASGRLRIVPRGWCPLGEQEFDRVIVAAAAASVPLLAEVDPKLGHHLVGIKGYGLMGTSDSPPVPAEQSGRGLHFLDYSRRVEAAYGRTTEDLRVKVWGGHVAWATDENVKPPYPFCDADDENKIFRQGPSCAKALVDLPGTRRMAGMRPVPSITGTALLKRYTGGWRNLFLNTGYGYNGYDLAWFASMCTVQWVLQDELQDPVCQVAVKLGAES